MSDPGFTYVPLRPSGDGHLWAVISLPTVQNRVAVVNFTSRRDPCDTSCVVGVGDHSFFRWETIVEYSRGYLLDCDILEDLCRKRYQANVPLNANLLRRVQDGALTSRFSSGVLQRAVRDTLEGQ